MPAHGKLLRLFASAPRPASLCSPGPCHPEAPRPPRVALCRLQAELEVLRAPAGAPPAAASLGYTPSNLQAEVASLRRQQAARLAQAQDAAEAAAAAAAGAGVAEEQAQQRHAVLEARLQAKQQVGGWGRHWQKLGGGAVRRCGLCSKARPPPEPFALPLLPCLQAAAMLARHLARQLLVLQLLQHEQAAVQNAQTVVAAARADAEMALQAALGRLASYDAQQQQRQQHAATPGTASSSTDEELATAEQLLACRAELQRLLGDVQASTLPGLHAAYSQLHGLLFGSGSSGDDGSNPAASEQQQQHGELELSLPAVREQLAAVAEAHAALNLQANALISEVYERQSVASSRPDSERALAERVLLEFWTAPQRLAARAAEQQRKLATYAA